MASLLPDSSQGSWGFIGLAKYIAHKDDDQATILGKKSQEERLLSKESSLKKFALALKILFGARAIVNIGEKYSIVPKTKLKSYPSNNMVDITNALRNSDKSTIVRRHFIQEK